MHYAKGTGYGCLNIVSNQLGTKVKFRADSGINFTYTADSTHPREKKQRKLKTS